MINSSSGLPRLVRPVTLISYLQSCYRDLQEKSQFSMLCHACMRLEYSLHRITKRLTNNGSMGGTACDKLVNTPSPTNWFLSTNMRSAPSHRECKRIMLVAMALAVRFGLSATRGNFGLISAHPDSVDIA